MITSSTSAGIDAGAIDERLERLGREVDRVPVLELAVAPAERGTDGVDDDRSGHGALLVLERARHGPTGSDKSAVCWLHFAPPKPERPLRTSHAYPGLDVSRASDVVRESQP